MIFHSYVKLPEGIYRPSNLICSNNFLVISSQSSPVLVLKGCDSYGCSQFGCFSSMGLGQSPATLVPASPKHGPSMYRHTPGWAKGRIPPLHLAKSQCSICCLLRIPSCCWFYIQILHDCTPYPHQPSGVVKNFHSDTPGFSTTENHPPPLRNQIARSIFSALLGPQIGMIGVPNDTTYSHI